MKFMYLTKRLVLQVLDEFSAPLVLQFYMDNVEHFTPFEPKKSPQFYTLEFQRNALLAEKTLLLTSSSVRYYLFQKEYPEKIIGTVCFYQIQKTPYNSCHIGYKLDQSALHRGYAYEAIHFLIPHIMDAYQLYRIQADIMKQNTPSMHLIKRLGFSYEGTARGNYEICGVRTDHEIYSFLYTDQ